MTKPFFFDTEAQDDSEGAYGESEHENNNYYEEEEEEGEPEREPDYDESFASSFASSFANEVSKPKPRQLPLPTPIQKKRPRTPSPPPPRNNDRNTVSLSLSELPVLLGSLGSPVSFHSKDRQGLNHNTETYVLLQWSPPYIRLERGKLKHE